VRGRLITLKNGADFFCVFASSWKKKLDRELKIQRKWSVKRPQKSWNFGKNNRDRRQNK